MTSLFSVQVQLTDTTPIFNGYFEVDDTTHVIQHFYDTSNISVDILDAPGAPANGDNTYQSGWASFSGQGCNITSFPYIFGSASGNYNLYSTLGDTSSSSGRLWEGNIGLDAPIDLVYSFTSIGAIPAPTSPIAQLPNLLYSIQLQLPTTAPIFNGYFETDVFNTIVHFYDTSNISTDIISSNNNYFNIYQPGWLSLNSTNLVSFAAIGASSSDFNVAGDTTDGSTNTGAILYNGGANYVNVVFTITSIGSIPASTDPIPATVLYACQIKTASAFTIMNAYFESNLISGLIQHFYDTTDSTTIVTDILTTGTMGEDNVYQEPGFLSFSTNGVAITTFPFLGASSSEFSLANNVDSNGNTNDNTVTWNSGASSQSGTVTFQYITSVPAPTGPITPPSPPSGVVCFKEGSKILTNTGYKPIQELRKGDLVQTSKNGYKAIFMIGKRDMEHIGSEERIKDQLYSCKQEQYPELLEELVITGCHSILVSDFKEGERERTRDVNGKIYVTDNKYRLPACVDMRASVYDKKGVHTIYHIALENDDYYMNYGVYANGLLVETCSKRYLKELSHMELF